MTKEDKQEIYDYMINTNHATYNTLKAIEELNELSLILTQSLSKGCDENKIIEELGDVKFRLKVIEARYDPQLIQERINYKLKKNLKYLKTKKYDNI